MANQRSSSGLMGSEARHNTPIQDDFSDTDFCADIENEMHLLSSRNSGLLNDMKFATSRGDEQGSEFEVAPRFSEFHAPSRLPRLLGKWSNSSAESRTDCDGAKRSSRSSIKDPFATRCQPKYIACDGLRASEQALETDHGDRTRGMESNTSRAIPLPKIDTYCISQTRPVTNHGFSYMVSANDLINAKKSRASRRQTRKTAKSNNAPKCSPGNSFCPCSGNVYLLFRAPSRVCGLQFHPFTVKTTPKRTGPHSMRSRALHEAANEVKTNIIRLPDINEEVWK